MHAEVVSYGAVADVVIVGDSIRPTSPEGDARYGLELGTNGTAATARRLLVAPPDANWTRHDGRPATGLTLVPSGRDDWRNPWDGGKNP